MYNLSTGLNVAWLSFDDKVNLIGRREPAVCPLILRTEPRMGSFRAQLIDEFFSINR